jgi:hypothetical protein
MHLTLKIRFGWLGQRAANGTVGTVFPRESPSTYTPVNMFKKSGQTKAEAGHDENYDCDTVTCSLPFGHVHISPSGTHGASAPSSIAIWLWI